jgi:dTDP-4-dehydrorhamnose 3,5-epimerase
MIFTETTLPGAYVLDLELLQDERGFFARTFCRREFTAHGLTPIVAQANISSNDRQGTVRGLHFQYPPSAEAKLVSCSRGAILDVVIDLRPESPTYLRHFAVELSADNRRSLYVPERFAHGYQVLEDHTETTYLVSEFYAPATEGGLAYDDPRLAIVWPLPVTDISPKDRAWARLDRIEPQVRAGMAVPVAAGDR